MTTAVENGGGNGMIVVTGSVTAREDSLEIYDATRLESL
jgi:hypothetical protein